MTTLDGANNTGEKVRVEERVIDVCSGMEIERDGETKREEE